MALQKKDFIEVEFTARVKDGEVFDSNIKEDINNAELKSKAKPFIFCLGEDMFLRAVEDFLIGKDIGEYELALLPGQAFGKREPKFVQMIPIKVFLQQELNPIPGIIFNFDGRIGKVLTVSGGRVMVDFNNPIAGKEVVYKIKVLRKVEDLNEKIKALNEFFFRRDLKFEIKDKKLILEVEKPMKDFVELFKEKFKELLDLETEVRESEGGKEEGKNFNQLYKKMKMKLNNNPKNYKHTLILAFAGVPGSGKTTIAKKLEEKYGAVRIGRTDIFNAVEELKLNKEDFESRDYQDFIFFLLEKFISYNTLIILDKCIERNYKKLYEFCKQRKLKKFIVNLEIDKEEALKRIFVRENVDEEQYKFLMEKWHNEYNNFKQQSQSDITLNGKNPDLETLFKEIEIRLNQS